VEKQRRMIPRYRAIASKMSTGWKLDMSFRPPEPESTSLLPLWNLTCRRLSGLVSRSLMKDGFGALEIFARMTCSDTFILRKVPDGQSNAIALFPDI